MLQINEEVFNRIRQAIGLHKDLLTIVKKRKLKWQRHVSRSNGQTKTTLQAQYKEHEKLKDGRDGKSGEE